MLGSVVSNSKTTTRKTKHHHQQQKPNNKKQNQRLRNKKKQTLCRTDAFETISYSSVNRTEVTIHVMADTVYIYNISENLARNNYIIIFFILCILISFCVCAKLTQTRVARKEELQFRKCLSQIVYREVCRGIFLTVDVGGPSLPWVVLLLDSLSWILSKPWRASWQAAMLHHPCFSSCLWVPALI